MVRLALLMMLAGTVCAAESAVDIDTAAKIYQAAAIREQVRASLGGCRRRSAICSPAFRPQS